MNRKTLTLVGAAVAVAALAAVVALRAQDDEVPPPASGAAAAKPALTVTVTTPRSGRWPVTVAANGTVAAWQEAAVGAEAQGLRLTEVRVNVGDRVRRGEVMARLQSQTTAAELAATRANLAEAQAAQAEARANAERARALQATGAISAQQIQQYQTAEATAAARVAALRARVDADQVRLAQTTIVAPDDGVVSARNATVGSVVAPGQELFRLIRQQRLEWRAEVPAPDLARLRAGMPATVTPSGGEPVKGRVRMVAPTVDPATRNGLVYVDLPQPGDARAGMFARGEFQVGTAEGLTLPQSAVLLRDGFRYVFVVGADQKVQQVKVETGRRLGDRVEITAGLPGGARVVEAGGGFLADGDLVHVVQPAAAASAAASAAPPAPAASR